MDQRAEAEKPQTEQEQFDLTKINPKASKLVKVFPDKRLPRLAKKTAIIALKDSANYLIGGYLQTNQLRFDWRSGFFYHFKLYKDGKEYFKFKFKSNQIVQDAVFVGSLSCFFLMVSGTLYRKDLNKRNPYRCMDCQRLISEGCSLRYSNLIHRMVALDVNRLTVLNLYTRKIELNYVHGIKETIVDYSIYGALQDRLMVLTRTGLIYLVRFAGVSVLESQKITDAYKRVIPSRLAVSDDSRFVCISAKDWANKKNVYRQRDKSNFIVFKIVGNQLKLSSVCNFERPVSTAFSDLCFFRKVGGIYLFVGFSKGSKNNIYFAAFDPGKKEVEELSEKRCNSKQAHPAKVLKAESGILMVGKSIKMNWLTIMD